MQRIITKNNENTKWITVAWPLHHLCGLHLCSQPLSRLCIGNFPLDISSYLWVPRLEVLFHVLCVCAHTQYLLLGEMMMFIDMAEGEGKMID